MSAKYDPGKVFAVDGFRNRSPKTRGGEPRLFVGRERRVGDLIEPHFLGIERSAGIVRHGRILSNYFVEIFGIKRVDEMNFSAGQTQHLDVTVLLNIKPYRFDVRQWTTSRILFPVVRIALQDQVRPGFVFVDVVGA